MKNILISIFTILLLMLTVIIMVRGISIGNFSILSINQIIEQSKALTSQIEDLNTLNNITYKNALSTLNDSTKKLATSKSNYLDIASVSSDSEIKAANQQQTYSMEYLWSQVGNHATAEGVNLKLEVNSTGVDDKNDLTFTVVGGYMGIRNFIYSIENDTNLNFKIENFKIVGGTTGDKSTGTAEDKLNCTFKVTGISIKSETVTTSTTDSSSTSSNASNTTNTTNSSTTTNKTSDSAARIDNAVQ